jgi:hypothetical protein
MVRDRLPHRFIPADAPLMHPILRALAECLASFAAREAGQRGKDQFFLAPDQKLRERVRAFSGKVESGLPSENATNAKMLKRFLFPVSVKPL